MLNVTDLRGHTPSKSDIRRALPRGGTDVVSVLPIVEPVVDDVQNRGAEAALDYGEKFDHIRPASVRVPAEVLKAAEDTLDPRVREAIEESIRRVRKVHADQKPREHTTELAPGGTVTERFLPIDRVGLYVPGGNAVYPSSVIMNAVPAQEAGVGTLVVASPPQADHGGWPHPTILAACSILGVDEVWAVGGAQAVALLAFGDDSADLEPVDIITGPGNIFVTAAKRLVRGVVGTDSEAGPTEIAILADDTANPVNVAYDLISQAEHDVMAASVLITDSEQLARDVNREIEARYAITRNADRVAEALRGKQSGIVLVDDIEVGIAVADQYAAEHLEVHTANAREVSERISNAGAIFVGDFSPVPLGDYSAGSNHVLPTSGTARFSAGLSTHTFLRPVNLIEYDEAALKDISEVVINFADAEDLPAHGEAIRARFETLPTTTADTTDTPDATA
ncbi:histidinol dehydrogenase [Corynebacterium efficiens YS-314]|uniref:Histidinol dehydrogenase n=1 Tax=Corynebacterium efficiens (strain DSM 44549 / YS-314 / AJ 12310 / JCM 11189 / NBRC 100395) TaxID=196164 RepID=HISX_COREF|nr:histidinol dehydrogenase [Corynebacterium efficiens]Q8FNZ0.1 RecName: Full=Histidinol dehydrogenase; Short=HDH [Corynebacterium efficiens YS-314]EEW49348.1 histidinol dehydrogenase [Corynebacterium efficiens YS-314]BAC18813.1 histidinol dehydrogenase [Corynebacterium efficiens YS-314]